MTHRTYPNLQAYLDHTHETQEVLARRLGISQSALSKIINHLQAPRLKLALKIERLCHVPLESLISATQEEQTGNSCV